ncbi:MAG: AraC family transcriptional regulator, partial [Calditrichota bacterium]
TLILEGYGKRFVGDSIETFSPGDIVMIGSNLPHVWLNDRVFYEEDSILQASALVLQFSSDLFSPALTALSEFRRISRLLQKSGHGLKIPSTYRDTLLQRIETLERTGGIGRFSKLLELLEWIEISAGYRQLSAKADPVVANENTAPAAPNDRLQTAIHFLVNNYHNDISVHDIASHVHMNTSAFCRFFKTHTRRTFTQYLNELRINYACKLLLDDGFSISQVCYESGFQNQSYFNRQFKRIMGVSPKVYRKDVNRESGIGNRGNRSLRL